MTSDIRNFISSCNICQKYQKSKIKDPMLNQDIPDIPFYKIAVDIAEFGGISYLVIIDYYSRWIEVFKLSNKTSSLIINKLKECFSRCGIPALMIADNMPFQSYEFKQFASSWNFKIQTSSPHYPRGHGLAEKAVGIVKMMLKKSKEENQDLQLYLLNYYNSPVAGLKYSPSELLNSRRLRSKLPVITQEFKPRLVPTTVHEEMARNQNAQKTYYDKTTLKNEYAFKPGERVMIQNINNKLWEEAVIIKAIDDSPRSYLVKTSRNQVLRRNIIHLRKTMNHETRHYIFNRSSNNREEGEIEQQKNSDNTVRDNCIKETGKNKQITRTGRVIKPLQKMNL